MTAAMLSAFLASSPVFAGITLPTGGEIVAGGGQIIASGSAMQVEQTSDRLIVSWESFDIGPDAAVSFVQPGAGSVVLNRVRSHNPSEILGSLTANGRVFLINPSGVFFGDNAQVDVEALVASTLHLSDGDFLAGNYRFIGESGAIVNRGHLDGGVVALIAPAVQNQGTITGDTALAGGTDVTLDFDGDGLIKVQVNEATVATLVENEGLIVADDGLVVLSAKGASDAMRGIVNNKGEITARRVVEQDGRILLLADMAYGEVHAGGKLTAEFIETSAANVGVDESLVIDTLGGQWLIDPIDITIDETLASAIQDALARGWVTVSTAGDGTVDVSGGSGDGSGDIIVNAPITWNQNRLTLRADRDIYINANLASTGSSSTAGLSLQYGQAGSGGDYHIKPGASISLNKWNHFSTKSGAGDTVTYTIITSLGTQTSSGDGTLQGIRGSLNGAYALGDDIDASDTAGWNGNQGFTPIGSPTSPFKGTFAGLGHTIADLTINRSGSEGVALFANLGETGVVRDVGLENVSVTGQGHTGALVGYNRGLVHHVHATGAVRGWGGLGGLVGSNDGGVIEHSYADVKVTGTSTTVGGLVASNFGGGKIRNSYAAGDVTAHGIVGGLVGYNTGGSIVENSYATGDVHSENMNAGGLVGHQDGGKIYNSYATGNVTGKGFVGGLAGSSGGTSGEIRNAYATGNVTLLEGGQGYAGGLTGNHTGGTIQNTLATGTVSGPGANVGALVGYSYRASNVQSSFYNLDAYEGAVPSNGYGVGKTLEELMTRSTFEEAGWDLEQVWGIRSDLNGGLPGFRVFIDFALPIVISLDSTSKTYGEANPDLGSWIVSGCDECVASIAFGTSITDRTNAGFYSYSEDQVLIITFTEGTHYDYKVSFENPDAGLSIHQAVITAVHGIKGVDREYDRTTDASLDISDVSFDGVLEGDEVAIADYTASFLNKYAGENKAVDYTIASLGGLHGGNYTLAEAAKTGSTTATIWPKEITAVYGISGVDREYDQSTDATLDTSGVWFDGVLEGDEVTIGDYTASFLNKYAGENKEVNYTILSLGDADAVNYKLVEAAKTGSTTATIWPKEITAVHGISGVDREYDRTTDATLDTSSVTFDGVLEGDEVSIADYTASFLNKHAGESKEVNYTILSLGDADAVNYTLVEAAKTGSTTATIWPKEIAAVHGISGVDREYDQSTDAQLNVLGATFEGMIEGDQLSVGDYTASFLDKHAQENKAVNYTIITLDGVDAGNYKLADAAKSGSTTATIRPKEITAVTGIAAQSREYDGTTNATLDWSGAEFTGKLGSDVLLVTSAVATFNDKNAGENKTVTISDITLGGADAGNYVLVDGLTSTTTATVFKVRLSVVDVEVEDKIFDGATSATVLNFGSLAGIVQGDDVALNTEGAVAVFADPNPGMGKRVEIAGLALVGADAGNYEIDEIVFADGDIIATNPPQQLPPESETPVIDTSIVDQRPPADPLGSSGAISVGVDVVRMELPTLAAGGGVEVFQGTLPVFNTIADGSAGSAIVEVTTEGSALSLRTVGAAPVQSAPSIDAATLHGTSASLTLSSGLQLEVNVSVTEDGVLVVSLVGDDAAGYDERELVLSAIATAQLRLGVRVSELTAVVLQSQ